MGANTSKSTQRDESTQIQSLHLVTDRKADEGSENESNKGTKKCHIQALERPHQSSYCLPGKLERRPMQFLIDTGCNTNLPSKCAFDQLPQKIKVRLDEND